MTDDEEFKREVRQSLASLNAKVDTIQTTLAQHASTMKFMSRLFERGIAELRHDARMLKSAINDLARENVTPGEITALQEEMTRLQGKSDEALARLDVIEGK